MTASTGSHSSRIACMNRLQLTIGFKAGRRAHAIAIMYNTTFFHKLTKSYMLNCKLCRTQLSMPNSMTFPGFQ